MDIILNKGGGNQLYQNNLDMVLIFEEELSLLSGQKGLPIQEDATGLINDTSALTKRYGLRSRYEIKPHLY
jgi:hypothetical protein